MTIPIFFMNPPGATSPNKVYLISELFSYSSANDTITRLYVTSEIFKSPTLKQEALWPLIQ